MSGFLAATAILMGYYLTALLAVPMALRAWPGMPGEAVRKTQHLGYGLSIWLLLALFERWYAAIAASALLVVVAYPALLALERWRGYGRAFADRDPRGGELRRSLLWVQLSFAANVALFWGLGGTGGRTALAAGVMAWTFGDALAAAVGRSPGRHAARGRFLNGDKSAEGTLAMAAAAGLAVAATVRLYGAVGGPLALAAGLLAGPLAAAVELYSPHGSDTLTVPFAAAAAVWTTLALAAWLAPWLAQLATGA
jgi:dolichol kinase